MVDGTQKECELTVGENQAQKNALEKIFKLWEIYPHFSLIEKCAVVNCC